MRAEVAMLTRNVKIYGVMDDECYDDELGDCADYPYDTFGAHTKARKGFKNYNIENAELYHVGQVWKKIKI